MNVNLDKQLTDNFKLCEFLTSKFYDKKQQKKVLESVNHSVLRNIKELAENLQVLRDEVCKPVIINIAFRPLWWEEMQGRSGDSQHVFGKAADIQVEGMQAMKVHRIISELIREGKMKNGGLGRYDTFTHYDIRDYSARW